MMPVYFVLVERRRIDLTHYLLYAIFKFMVATIAHVNLYTLSKWNALYWSKNLVLTAAEEQETGHQQHLQRHTHLNITKCLSPSNSIALNDHSACAMIKAPVEI
jgi:hypothetical protein